ncbi:glucose import [Tritrichomonas musculus]|uniref:Glucose import n=1 Tax=Tritrichomonas musculus TaxID=1915356 RepID=A0ABR2JR10_9EUKA
MSNSQNFLNVLIILSLPFQFSFHLNYYIVNSKNIQHDWDYTKISNFQLEVSERITSYFAAISSIIWIFASYKIRKRRLPIMINFIIGGVVWLLYILINDETLWLAIILRAINGILLGFFQSVHISFMMHFVEKDLTCFHGCLIQFTMFLSLCTLYILTYNLPWIPVCIILSVQSFAFAGLIWLVVRLRGATGTSPFAPTYRF